MGGAPLLAAERRVVSKLRERQALSRESAQPLPDLPFLQRRRLAHLMARRVVLESRPGYFYLDEAGWRAHRAARLRIALILLIVLVALPLLLVWIARLS